MAKIRFLAFLLLVVGAGSGFLVYLTQVVAPGDFWHRPFKLGLDLQGGSHLVYEADTSAIASNDINGAMDSLREVIDRRVNAFGVAEPMVQVEKLGLGTEAKNRLIVELPGVTDLQEALTLINVTPLLEFWVEDSKFDPAASTTAQAILVPTLLTGRHLKHARVEFVPGSLGPSISLEFNDEGAKLFGEITEANVGKPIAIILDGELKSAPVVREAIRDGRAEISGQFTVDEAREQVRNLNLGALPVPIQLVSTETVGATLGEQALNSGVRAGLIGLLAVAIFMILWYRLNGVVALLSLLFYIIVMLVIFKLLPVTLTAAGIAGLILSFGMALDANILIAERLKEELRAGKHLHEAIKEGFARAWFSIRDSNLSSLISAIVLFWFGTSFIKGFALTLSLGLIIGMFTSILVTRAFLLSIAPTGKSKLTHFLFGSGFKF